MMTGSAAVQLPPSLADLETLAYNLRWSWHAPARALFERIDAELWQRVHHNPVALLLDVDRARLAELAADAAFVADVKAQALDLRRYLRAQDTWHGAGEHAARCVAYFSAEYAIAECLPIFAGGLGVLAGDHLKSASDLGVPLAGVGLLYHLGYFTQQVDADGNQRDVYTAIDPERLPLHPVFRANGQRMYVSFPARGHHAFARVWRADIGRVPLYLLDTNILDNRPEDRRITDRLYGGDNEHRLRQEIVLGIAGMRALRAAGHEPDVLHLNEGHAAFAALERARGSMQEPETFRDALARSSHGVVFTTHTPVPAGHDYFPHDLLEKYLGGMMWEVREPWDRFVAAGSTPHDARFCMTAFAIRMAGRRNGVSRLHAEVSRDMWKPLWPGVAAHDVPITHVTNGVHLPTWVGAPVAALLDTHIGAGWRSDADSARWEKAASIPLDAIAAARAAQRSTMIHHVRARLAAEAARRGEDGRWTERALEEDALTIVFARRFATYKRATLLLSQPERLMALLRDAGRPVQFVFAGKAHPKDGPGQAMLKQVVQFARMPEFRTRFAFLEGYDVALARHLVQGADVWLNVPVRPLEASGTSGMKSAVNGGLNLSIADGWWAEAWDEHNRLADPIGWSIVAPAAPDQDRADADALFHLLENEVVPLFHERGDNAEWDRRIRSSLRQVGGFFSTHRMLREYVSGAYDVAAAGSPAPALAASQQRVAAR